MRLSLLVILLSASLLAAAQKPAKTSPSNPSHAKPAKDSAKIAAASPQAQNPATPCYLIMPRYRWYQLVQLLDASEGSHSQVKDLITYISTNAKEVPPPQPDSLAKPKP